MDPMVFGAILLFLMLFLLLLGVPIAVSMIAVALGGIYFLQGSDGLNAVSLQIWEAITPFILTCVPLYLLLGTIFTNSGLAETLYDGIYKWSSRLPGSLAIATTLSCGIFAAISGSSVATAAIFSKVSVPSMLKKGYPTDITSATVAAGGTLGILIPPSIPFILYGVIAEESVGKLFIAGVIPGMMVMIIFILYQVWTFHRNMEREESERFSFTDKLKSIKGIIPFASIMLIIIGTIYGGVATPTEAAAVSVVASLIMAMLIYRTLNLKGMWVSVKEAVASSAMILMIIIGAMLFGYLLTLANIPQTITENVMKLNMSKWLILIAINILLVFLGMFLEVVSIIVITVPIIAPIIKSLGWDLIWFGVILVINMEMALITPPVGLNLYVLKDAFPDLPFETIVKGVYPYIIFLAASLAILAIYPQMALWLPSRMM
ncbi:MAG: TRAP transporter large permease subunit [Deltaproteobacteria bacterium]|nr:TRAP transporter large permease subunit [Deltaproteobacteria bacterium]